MHTEKLIAKSGKPCEYGIRVYVDSYEDAMSIPKEQLDQWVYENKLLVIKGMRGVSKLQFWEFSNRFGAGAWYKTDYNVGKEQCMPIDDSGKVYAHYSNSGQTAKAIGDADMSWHVDIPLWPSHQAPLRSFYALSIPDNRYGITSFADRAWGYRNMTSEEQSEAEHWSLLYQSWYEPGTHLTYLPVVGISPYDGHRYLQFTSFSNSEKKYSHHWHNFKVHGWIFGARKKDAPHNADYVSFLHEKTIQPDNIFDLVWEEEDFAIWNNVHMIHSRTALHSKLHSKPREFLRMNMFNSWQK